jgi:XTP/dITP diphosphohydrolase
MTVSSVALATRQIPFISRNGNNVSPGCRQSAKQGRDPVTRTSSFLNGSLVAATHNPGKVRELRALLEPLGLEVVSAGELGLPEPEETEFTFAGNAVLKARAAAMLSGLPALSDDSGLEVFALGGLPGVFSARWAGPGKDFGVAMEKVRDLLAAADTPDRSARFVCALALAMPSGVVEVFEGEVRGEVTFPPRGEHGFGYDPIFVRTGDAQTFGEMDPALKHAISHRADAFARFRAYLVASGMMPTP